MEAVPRLQMLWFPVKECTKDTRFDILEKYIAKFYPEDHLILKNGRIAELQNMRLMAFIPKDNDANQINALKRYYCQLHYLQHHFPQLVEKKSPFTFKWKGLYDNKVHEYTDLRYEQAVALFNIAAAHTREGASVTRTDVDGMKLACTHFQCAAWAFGELRDRYANIDAELSGDMLTTELLVFMQQVSFAQAQECILEKSLIDNRKPNIVAKVTAQIIVYYGAALAALLTGGDKGPIATVVTTTIYKLWKKYVRFKISYLNCILYLYQGQQAEEQKKMGERVALFEAAWEKLEEARKESKGLPDEKIVNECLIFTADVVEAKRKNAKSENEFIYHEAVPELNTISAVQGANLVNGIGFSITDPEVTGKDLFASLIPMKTHEASSMYSEEKATLLRKYGGKIEEKDAELTSFMSSLALENLNINEEKANKLPQGIVDRCASLNANETAIPDLISSMARLSEICIEVESNLKEIGAILTQEEKEERAFQQVSGVQRPPNAHITELLREYQKYSEAHQKAGESNETLRKAMELHINNLKILAKPLPDIQQSVPKLSSELNTAELFKDVKLIVNKVNEMKAQRSQFHADLRIAVNNDDITAKVLAHGSEEGLQHLFGRELEKHERITQLIDQNLLAQENILKSLTESYAKAAPVLKTLADVKHKRESFFAALAASFDVYEDLLAKSSKGLEFYIKLSANVQKLLSRCKSAKDVQTEERQQRLIGAKNKSISGASNTTISTTPKLRDYLKSKNSGKDTLATGHQYIPPVRPNPLGSENPSQTLCSSSAYYPNSTNNAMPTVAVGPNEPPPPYSVQQTPYVGGYTNPMYMQYQQNIAPPAYKLQASPNSQLAAHMAAMTIQQQHQQQQQQQPNTSQFNNYNTAAYNANQITPMLAQSHIESSPAVTLSSRGSTVNTLNNFPQVYSKSDGIPQAALASTLPPTYVSYNDNQNPAVYPNCNNNNANNYQQHSQQDFQNYNSPMAAAPLSGSTGQPLYVTTAQTSQTTTNNLQNPYLSNNFGTPTPNQYMAPTVMSQSELSQPQLVEQMPPQQRQSAATQYAMTAYQQQQQQQAPVTMTAPNNTFQVPPTVFMQNPQTGGPSHPPAVVLPPSTINTNIHNFSQSQQQSSSSLPAVSQQSTFSYNATLTHQLPTQTTAASSTTIAPPATTTSIPSTTMASGISQAVLQPTYACNPQTVIYDYNKGHQQLTATTEPIGAQYTSGVLNTDSKDISKMNISTGSNSPIVSHTKNNAMKSKMETPKSINYYNSPYGYQMNNNFNQDVHSSSSTATNNLNSSDQQAVTVYQPPITAPTTTATAVTHMQSDYEKSSVKTTENIATKKTIQPQPVGNEKKKCSIDLLTDTDLTLVGGTPPILPEPALKPEILTSPACSQVKTEAKEKVEPPVKTENKQQQIEEYLANQMTPEMITTAPMQLSSPVDSPAARKSSLDNLSNCSELSSLDNFDWDSVSMRSDKMDKHCSVTNHLNTNTNIFLMLPQDPFTDDKVLKYFHKEVERFEKIIETLNVKMLSGHTPLTAKWKELQDLLSKEAPTRTTTIARLFPEKNRSLDCLPYDHARVKLDKDTDDYINAAYVKNLGNGCPNFIMAQTPQPNTVNDFWSMLWSQKARTVLCLHPPNELLDPFWPQALHQESHFDDFSVKCVKIVDLSHCSEYQLNLSTLNSDAIIELAVLQIKSWVKNNNMQILNIARNALQAHQQRCLDFKTPNSPLVLNCLTGSERSGLVAMAICAILATQNKRPMLINVIDVWQRICSQRQQGLRDTQTLERSFEIVLNHAHDVLNKRGIVTSYQMKIAPQVTAQEKQASKDPLNELDALWKLKC